MSRFGAYDGPRFARPGRGQRRLSDEILGLIHFACDQEDFMVAERLLGILERMVAPKTPDAGDRRRGNVEGLVSAHVRLWSLRHKDL